MGFTLRSFVFAAIFFLQLVSSACLANVSFVGVPERCARALAALADDSKAPVVKEVVDWSEVRQNLLYLGYPERIVSEKLASLSWEPDVALAEIRLSTTPNWIWGDPITESMLQSLGASYLAPSIAANLPIWDSLIGFETPLVISEALNSANLQEDSLKSLAQFAPLWLKGTRALENAQRYLARIDVFSRLGSAPWVLANLAPADREQLTKQLLDEVKTVGLNDEDPFQSAPSSLGLVATLPWEQMPENARQHLVENWVDFRKYPAEKMDSIRYVTFGVQYAGCCRYMTYGHLTSLGLTRIEPAGDTPNWKESVLIRVKGKLVGSLKLTGDPSMIALRNVLDSDGRMILALGGTYHLEKDLYDRIRTLAKNADEWRVVDLEELRVHPWTFLLNPNAWDYLNEAMLLQLGNLDAATAGALTPKQRHNATWRGILEALDRFRIKFEESTPQRQP